MLKAKPNFESGIRQLFTTCVIEKTVTALGETSIGRWLLLKMMCGTHMYVVIKQPVNSNIAFSLIMTNLLPYIQNVKPLGKMLKQL
ncbi:hypothetical protein Golob_013057 [Gossypium lobatum]|uniref:Uncharacterized protein n=1 Tax=Gossypium lobatum TaxID=34289 RepID=A0A7J8LNB3_9ROSI|nr:hypothetical protein [Gossypium lobatum]